MLNRALFEAAGRNKVADLLKKSSLLFCVLFISSVATFGQSRFGIKGMYLQWGYNTEWFTRRDIHFKGSVNGVPHDFTAYNVKGVDQNDMDAIWKKPIQVSVPQYNYRIGFYLNKEKTKKRSSSTSIIPSTS